MKRATSVSLICMGVGAVIVANAFENRCSQVDSAQAVTVNPDGTVKPVQPQTSCRSSSGYSHGYSHSSSSGVGLFSGGVARGGFGGFGSHSGG